MEDKDKIETTVDTAFAEQKESTFTSYRSKIKQLYGNNVNLSRSLGLRDNTRNLTAGSDAIRRDVENAAKAATHEDGRSLSQALAKEYRTYDNLLDYFSSMFYYRYYVVPTFIGKNDVKTNDKDYTAMYNEMIRIAEGLNLEVILPQIIHSAAATGIINILTERNKTSSVVELFILPERYCKIVSITQFGTNVIAFDFRFFDNLKSQFSPNQNTTNTQQTFEELMANMPQVLQDLYAEYTGNKRQPWLVLDSRVATAFVFGSSELPPFLHSGIAAVDAANYATIELDRTANELQKILTHEIASNSDGELVMSIEEAMDVDDMMRSALSGVSNLKLLTVFGDTKLHDLQKSRDKESRILSLANELVYANAGINPNLFVGQSEDSILASLKKDKSKVWTFLQPVMLFFNMAVNNFYNFKPYQMQITLLPITVYDDEKMIKSYIEAAGSGIGRLQAVVATGIKQREIADIAAVEKLLDLENILVPLKSMHVSSGNGRPEGSETDDTKNENNE